MKTHLTISFFTIMFLLAGMKRLIAQNPSLPQRKCTIVMENNKRIKNVQLWDLHSGILEYEREGSLHDASISAIKQIEDSAETWLFDSTGMLKKAWSDLIITKSNDSINCKITEVNSERHFIVYILKGTSYETPITFDKIRKYFIGGKEVVLAINDCLEKEDSCHDVLPFSKQMYFDLGTADAEKYYNGTGAFIGGLYTGITPVIGWIIGLPLLTGIKPSVSSNKNPNLSLLENKDYHEGYLTKARSKKTANVMGGFGLGFIVLIAAVL